MIKLTPELLNYLNKDDRVKQVIVKVKVRFRPVTITTERQELLDAYEEAAEKNRARMIQALSEECNRDKRVAFNSMGPVNKLIVVAPKEVILRIARHSDVEEISLNSEFDATE